MNPAAPFLGEALDWLLGRGGGGGGATLKSATNGPYIHPQSIGLSR